MRFELRALTDIWTGGVERKNDKLHLSGIKGSLRWWHEVLVRGLGGSACDPTDQHSRCSLDQKLVRGLTLEERLRKIKGMMCPSCYFFGCTGWGGKVLLRVWANRNDGATRLATESLIANDTDMFVLEFLPQKKIELIEEALIKALLKLIVGYGALGAKTVFKPSEVDAKNKKPHHRDFGIIGWARETHKPQGTVNSEIVKQYLRDFKEVKPCAEWPDLRRFWFVAGKHLTRLEHNRVVSRSSSGNYVNPSGKDIFLGGFISREKSSFPGSAKAKYKDLNAASKKIFSFHGRGLDDPVERCFGYIPDDDVDTFISKLTSMFPNKFSETDFHKGSDLISRL